MCLCVCARSGCQYHRRPPGQVKKKNMSEQDGVKSDMAQRPGGVIVESADHVLDVEFGPKTGPLPLHLCVKL